jgi:hypothetical protein
MIDLEPGGVTKSTLLQPSKVSELQVAWKVPPWPPNAEPYGIWNVDRCIRVSVGAWKT